MASFTRPTPHIHLDEPGFFARPISRWLSMLALLASVVLCFWVLAQQGTAEQVIKLALFTLPASVYLLYRSFVRQV